MIEVLPILCQAAASSKPADGSFDNPSLRQNHEASLLVAAPHNLAGQVRRQRVQTLAEDRSTIAAVRKKLLEKGELTKQCSDHHQPAITVLHVGRRDHRVQQQTQRIYQDMAFLALDALAFVKAGRIDASPPFSALLTLWLSTMQAAGLASRSAWSRHLTYSA